MPLAAGDYVHVRRTGERGRVVEARRSACPFGDVTLASQHELYGPVPMRFVNAQWCAVLMDSRDVPRHSLQRSYRYYPVDLLEVIPEFDLQNADVSYYFPATVVYAPDENYRIRRGSSWITGTGRDVYYEYNSTSSASWTF